MDFVTGTSKSLAKGLYNNLAHYRYRVFVETLGWQMDTPVGVERDQFDREDTVYVVSRDYNNNINGCARLLPTTAPYLLAEIFPQLLHGLPVPSDPDTWELSRFAAIDFNDKNTSPLHQCSSPIAVELLRQSIACARKLGAKRLITVSPVGIERLLRRAGFNAKRAGPPIIVDGHALFACLIDVNENT